VQLKQKLKDLFNWSFTTGNNVSFGGKYYIKFDFRFPPCIIIIIHFY